MSRNQSVERSNELAAGFQSEVRPFLKTLAVVLTDGHAALTTGKWFSPCRYSRVGWCGLFLNWLGVMPVCWRNQREK